MMRLSLRTLAALSVVLLVVAARVVVGAQSELAAGDALSEAGDEEGAVLHWRRAAKWHVPGGPFSRQAIEQLVALAESRESSGDAAGALVAWRSVHAAALGARSFYVPFAEARTRADDRIAALMRGEPSSAEDLRSSRAAGPFFFLALLGLFLFAAGVLMLAERGLDAEDRVLRSDAQRYGVLAAVGLAALVTGLALA